MSAQPLGTSIEHLTRVNKDQAKALRQRSLALLGELLKPKRAKLALLAVVIVIAQIAGAAGPLLLSLAIDRALPLSLRGEQTTMVLLLAGIALAGITEGVLTSVFLRGSASLSQDVLFGLRTRLFAHAQRLGLDFHQRYTSGRVISRQTNDIESIRELFEAGLGDLVTAVSRMAFLAVAMTLLDPITALMAGVALIPVVAHTRWFQRAAARLYRESSERSARLIVKFVETIAGMRAVQAFRAEARNERQYGRLNREYAGATQRMVMAFGRFFVGLSLINAVTVAVVVGVNGLRALDGQIGVGVLVAGVLYVVQFFQPMEAIGMFSNTFQSAAAALEKISGVLEERPTVAEPRHPVRSAAARAAGVAGRLNARSVAATAGRPGRTGRVEFASVDFGYSSDRLVLHDMDLTIPAGQTVAIVGQTGAGKSTIASLVARFADPVGGTVTLDGVDLRSITDDELRQRVVMVTQDTFLFQGTIASNIALGRPGATRADLERAIDAIGARSFIDRLPAGIDTDISHRGVRLSAGQRQLVSFARAFIANPDVLILDEATSSLDLPSERAVQRALDVLLEHRTAIIIAHRLSTVADADRVLVIDDGRIVEDGAPQALIREGGKFAAMHDAWERSVAGV